MRRAWAVASRGGLEGFNLINLTPEGLLSAQKVGLAFFLFGVPLAPSSGPGREGAIGEVIPTPRRPRGPDCQPELCISSFGVSRPGGA